jgi:hypothetical protein
MLQSQCSNLKPAIAWQLSQGDYNNVAIKKHLLQGIYRHPEFVTKPLQRSNRNAAIATQHNTTQHNNRSAAIVKQLLQGTYHNLAIAT